VFAGFGGGISLRGLETGGSDGHSRPVQDRDSGGCDGAVFRELQGGDAGSLADLTLVQAVDGGGWQCDVCRLRIRRRRNGSRGRRSLWLESKLESPQPVSASLGARTSRSLCGGFQVGEQHVTVAGRRTEKARTSQFVIVVRPHMAADRNLKLTMDEERALYKRRDFVF
jgi:hypothetical protein